jgi:hypothetical protein
MSRRNFCFRDDDLDFHPQDWRLGSGKHRKHKVSPPVFMVFKKSTPWSATEVRPPARLIVFLCVQDLAFLEQSVDKQYCKRFQLIFLLSLISPEYSFVGHFAQHCAHARCIRHLSKLTVTNNANLHRHSNGHNDNAYATSKPEIPSLQSYHRILQAFVMSTKEICEAKHNTLCSHAVL